MTTGDSLARPNQASVPRPSGSTEPSGVKSIIRNVTFTFANVSDPNNVFDPDKAFALMDMSETSQPVIDEIDLLLANARLRDELEPYRDDSIDDPSVTRMPLRTENEYLASMLAWERAPALPIAHWFNPALELPGPESLSQEGLGRLLKQTIQLLYSQGIVLRFTDHLSDRELYTIIYRDILPACEKKIDVPGKNLEWRCVEDNDTWLRFYADAVERRRFQEEHEVDLPPSEQPRFRRKLPGN